MPALLLILSGCLQEQPHTSSANEQAVVTDQPNLTEQSSTNIEVEYSATVSGSSLRAEGKLFASCSEPLSYLLLNASFLRGDSLVDRIKYLLIRIEPGQEYSFDIAENIKLPTVDGYACVLEVTGPQGVHERLVRVCKPMAESGVVHPLSPQVTEDDAVMRTSAPSSRSADGQSAKTEQPVLQSSRPKEENVSPIELSGIGDAGSTVASSDKGVSKVLEPVTSDGASGKAIDSGDALSGVSLPTTVVISKSSKKFHRPDCRYAIKIRPENRIEMSLEEAIKEGLQPCKVCNPQ
jgi:hypothetical protein